MSKISRRKNSESTLVYRVERTPHGNLFAVPVIDDVLSSHLDDWFVDAINSLARLGEPPIGEVLFSIDEELEVEGTRAVCTCHMIRPDGNGRPQVDALARYLTTRIVEYCIPRSRINWAAERLKKTGSPQEMVRLNEEARSLFVSIEFDKDLAPARNFLFLDFCELVLGQGRDELNRPSLKHGDWNGHQHLFADVGRLRCGRNGHAIDAVLKVSYWSVEVAPVQQFVRDQRVERVEPGGVGELVVGWHRKEAHLVLVLEFAVLPLGERSRLVGKGRKPRVRPLEQRTEHGGLG